jgi:hypothetical protein
LPFLRIFIIVAEGASKRWRGGEIDGRRRADRLVQGGGVFESHEYVRKIKGKCCFYLIFTYSISKYLKKKNVTDVVFTGSFADDWVPHHQELLGLSLLSKLFPCVPPQVPGKMMLFAP